MSVGSSIPVDASAVLPAEAPEPYRRPVAVGLHLLPGVLFFAGCVIFRPLTEGLGLPDSLGFTLAGLVLVTPFEFAYLVRRGRGRGRSLREAVAASVGFRRKLPVQRLVPLVVALIAFTAVTLAVLSPVSGFLEHHVFEDLPDWMRSGNDDLAHFSTTVAVVALLLNIVGDCVLSPVAEELYYRGHLMARLPTGPVTAAVTGAALFAATHFWEPELVVFVFVVQSVMGLVVRRTGSVRVSVYLHIAVNSITTAMTVAALLS
ncbi:CPBP family intramembrane glutamic endopeptidase [Streptomyces liangshanensis]|uniref:CPBP family intramembrane metalloprotease n=1 Tax=Streptomyces liangshanensis TaxID=2717324 RepID=A0A6G9GXJ4_9ACTN|nr:CPBP family intramembrane glutamic endopeptidase [Streptomyces liangshanensis]QIQ02945.1 CPBP family intramembrane metalloprotease [Streptomyces liangshanensis]